MCSAEKLTAVLVHGWGGSPRTWNGIAWPEHWRILPYTLPGHGHRHDDGPWTIPAAAEDLADYIRGSVPAGERVLLIGHSMGGQLTAMVQATHPELVLGEVVIDPAYGGDDSPVDVADMVAQLEAMRNDPFGTLFQFIEGAFSPYLPQAARDIIRQDIAATNPTAFGDYFESEYLAEESFGLRTDTPTVTMRRTRPVLGIYGSEARGAMEREVDPVGLDVSLSVWQGGHGHFLHMEDPQRFVRCVEEWSGCLDGFVDMSEQVLRPVV